MLDEYFTLNEKLYKIIPINWGNVEFYAFSFQGFKYLTFDINNEDFLVVLNLASSTTHKFIEFYKDKYAFMQPVFGWRPDTGDAYVKIGMMKLEEYDERMKKREGSNASSTENVLQHT